MIGQLTRAGGAMEVFEAAQGVVAHNIANVSTDSFASKTMRFASAEPLRGVVPSDIADAESRTDIPRELVMMTSYQHAYAANAAIVRTYDETIGFLLDMTA